MGQIDQVLVQCASTLRSSIPYAEPHYWGNERAYAADALDSNWISGGPYVERFETAFAAYVEAPHFVATSNGTTALHAAFLALGVGVGDEVVVPGFAFMAAANVLLNMRARPVFADVDPDNWCVTAETIAAVLTPRCKGIVPVHSYGSMCEMEAILALAEDRGVWVLEDAAEAIGSCYRGRQAGTLADIGSVSFHASKTITTGEGGGVIVRDEGLAERLRLYRSHGVAGRRYWHEVAGLNFRMTNVQAAIGCGQLESMSAITAAKRHIHLGYGEALARAPGLALQAVPADVDPVLWAVAVRLDPSHYPQGRDRVLEQMQANGIECRPGFYSAGQLRHIYGDQRTPVSDAVASEVLSLPLSPPLSDGEIERIARALIDCAEQR